MQNITFTSNFQQNITPNTIRNFYLQATNYVLKDGFLHQNITSNKTLRTLTKCSLQGKEGSKKLKQFL